MAEELKNRAQVKKKYGKLSKPMQDYFKGFSDIIAIKDDIALDILIAYLFMRVEQAHLMTLYAGLLKKYKIDKKIAVKVLDNLRISRSEFIEFYETLAKKPLEAEVTKKIQMAEETRDKIMHGRSLVHGQGISDADKVATPEKRRAIAAILDYAIIYNKQTKRDFGFQPFGGMKGFKGNAQPFDKETSRWVLTGMGFLEAPKAKKTKKQAAKEKARQNNNQEPVAPAPVAPAPAPANPQAQDNPA